MNKPAPKEPSMDEILSSIRQIIADDDAAAPQRRSSTPFPSFSPVGSSGVIPPRTFTPPPPPVEVEIEADPEPLALSAEQILRETAVNDAVAPRGSFRGLVERHPARSTGSLDSEDVVFELEDDEEAYQPAPAANAPSVVASAPQPQRTPASAPPPRQRQQPAAQSDQDLSHQMAEQLLEPATQSAVRSTFAKLNSQSVVGSALTLEEMMREMLRPMLKEWLDEHLPAVVERMVEQEIARVSRGGF